MGIAKCPKCGSEVMIMLSEWWLCEPCDQYVPRLEYDGVEEPHDDRHAAGIPRVNQP